MSELDVAAPAIVIRLNAQVGANRTMDVQFAVPLDMTLGDLNKYIDKVMSVCDRQNNKGILEAARITLEKAHQDLETNISNRAMYETKQSIDFSDRGKRGEWKPNGAEAAQLRNFDTNDKNIRENIIPRIRKQIEELESKVAINEAG